MEFINVTSLAAGYTTATDKTGREHLVVVAKATYSFPSAAGAAPERAQPALPLIMTDTFTGEPGFSAPLDENDFQDVMLLNLTPGGRVDLNAG